MDNLSKLINEYRDSLIFFVNRTVGNLDLAEDIAADTFAELIYHPHAYDRNKASIKTYLFTIAHNKMVSHIRHAKKYTMLNLDEVPEVSSEYKSFEENIFLNERKLCLHKALNTINSDYREALHLIYFEDMSYEEAARVMHKNKKQLDNLVFRGKKAVKEILEKEGFIYEE